jgi:hypothetical protein
MSVAKIGKPGGVPATEFMLSHKCLEIKDLRKLLQRHHLAAVGEDKAKGASLAKQRETIRFYRVTLRRQAVALQ